MKFLGTLVILAAFITPAFTTPSPKNQKTGAENFEVENVEHSCRPRLSKNCFTTVIKERLIDSI